MNPWLLAVLFVLALGALAALIRARRKIGSLEPHNGPCHRPISIADHPGDLVVQSAGPQQAAGQTD